MKIIGFLLFVVVMYIQVHDGVLFYSPMSCTVCLSVWCLFENWQSTEGPTQNIACSVCHIVAIKSYIFKYDCYPTKGSTQKMLGPSKLTFTVHCPLTF